MTKATSALPPGDRHRLRAFLRLAFAWTWLRRLPALWRSSATEIPLPTNDEGLWVLRVLAGFAMSIGAMGFVQAWVYNSTGSVARNVLLRRYDGATLRAPG